jgi:hypothetical protein
VGGRESRVKDCLQQSKIRDKLKLKKMKEKHFSEQNDE